MKALVQGFEERRRAWHSVVLRVAGLLWAAPLALCPVQAKLNVVATTPDLAAVAREVGGDLLTITTLAKPVEDAHFVDPRPSFIARLNRADALITGGAELEAGWLPPLLDSARNRKLSAGAPGLIRAAKRIKLVEVPDALDRSRGDVHAMGNPHFMVDPVNARLVAQEIADAFCRVDQANAPAYRANLDAFFRRLESKLSEWEAALKPFAGARLAAYHNTWLYFGKRFGLKIDLFLEPKPGLPPAPAHLASVISKMRVEKVKIIIIEPYQHRRTAEAVAEATGAKVLLLTQQPGAVRGTEAGYIELLDFIVGSVAKVLADEP